MTHEGTWSIPDIQAKTNACPLTLIDSLTFSILELHDHYTEGNLLVAGGITDQPHAYRCAMRMVSRWKREAMKHG
ncbi:MAG: hypothetical protein AAFR07_05590 [Pseudomonadota bacterium]